MSNTPAPSVNITELLRDGRHFAEKRGDRIHIVDSLTGNTYVAYGDSRDGHIPTRFVEHTLPTGVKIWIEEGIEPVPSTSGRHLAFSPHIIDLLCQRVAQGEAVTEICQTEGMPKYAQLRQWARIHTWIDQELERARRDRAESLRDKALRVALDSVSKDPVDADKLKVDTLKWTAGVDHEKYNPKTKVEATVSTPTMIVVQTGIDRTPVREVQGIPQELQKYDE